MLVAALTLFIVGGARPVEAIASRAADVQRIELIVPPGLPTTFGLGVSSSDTRWMTESQVPWTYRYQYLTGGVNTGRGWATWRRDGTFVRDYLRDSEALNAIPVFTYYQLLVSEPAAGSNEQTQVLSNLANARTMAAYFADYSLLLRRLAPSTKTVIVHLEPDLSGYAQQVALTKDNDASSVPAAVASSGFVGLGDLPNNYRGYQQALVRLRDQIAPRVLLATHVSAWSAGHDIALAKDPKLDVEGIAAKTTAFLSSAGLSELVFLDPADRDAAFEEKINGTQGAHWWDSTGQRFPNFNRYNAYLSIIARQTKRALVLWQVPVGNTVTRSQNNTWNHFQDNRVEYWLGNYPNDGQLRTLANSGVTALLFGAGADGNTSYEDRSGDGITNPTPIGANTQVATVADDDGGYLRQRAAIYYRSPLALGQTVSTLDTPVASLAATTTSAVKATTSTPPSTTPTTSTSTPATTTVRTTAKATAKPRSRSRSAKRKATLVRTTKRRVGSTSRS